jgi:murein L,D-transpeptidase YcbB/YkuD
MFIKINQKGFSHHLIIPIIAVFVVGGIGTYLAMKSSAYSYMSGSTPYTCNQDPTPTLRYRSTGSCVKALQYALNQWISYQRIPISKLVIDGSFGGKTLDAVKRFQERQGLNPDGVVGSKTWAKLASGCGIRYSCSGVK